MIWINPINIKINGIIPKIDDIIWWILLSTLYALILKNSGYIDYTITNLNIYINNAFDKIDLLNNKKQEII